MKTSLSSLRVRRRDFLRAGAGAAATVVAAGPAALSTAASAADRPAAPRRIGLQIGAVSFVDEGTEPVLDILQERGAVNTIFLTTFTYGRGLAGRQIPGQPFPDHGKQESDEKTFQVATTPRPTPSSTGTRS